MEVPQRIKTRTTICASSGTPEHKDSISFHGDTCIFMFTVVYTKYSESGTSLDVYPQMNG